MPSLSPGRRSGRRSYVPLPRLSWSPSHTQSVSRSQAFIYSTLVYYEITIYITPQRARSIMKYFSVPLESLSLSLPVCVVRCALCCAGARGGRRQKAAAAPANTPTHPHPHIIPHPPCE